MEKQNGPSSEGTSRNLLAVPPGFARADGGPFVPVSGNGFVRAYSFFQRGGSGANFARRLLRALSADGARSL